MLEQEKREQQQQQPIPTSTTQTATTNLPPGAQPLPSVPTDPTTVGVNPTMVTGQIVPNQPGQIGPRAQAPGQLQKLQPQLTPTATTVQSFMPRTGPPGSFTPSQLPTPPNQRMIRPGQPGSIQQSWPPRHPQEVTLQQRGPGATTSVPQGSMMQMQVQPQHPTLPIGQTSGPPQMGAQQQPQAVVPGTNQPHPGLTPAGTPTPPPALETTPPPHPPENPQTDDDRLKVNCDLRFAKLR